jgi:hypothetical protein
MAPDRLLSYRGRRRQRRKLGFGGLELELGLFDGGRKKKTRMGRIGRLGFFYSSNFFQIATPTSFLFLQHSFGEKLERGFHS